MDPIGAEMGLRMRGLDVHIQHVEKLDLEQSDNLWEKVIHIMWKTLTW